VNLGGLYGREILRDILREKPAEMGEGGILRSGYV
jgi:hypothetical protein